MRRGFPPAVWLMRYVSNKPFPRALNLGFVGLLIPHLARLLVGADHRRVLPSSALLGASLLLLADLVSRLAVLPAELPIGIVTSLIGAPFFLWLLLVRRPSA